MNSSQNLLQNDQHHNDDIVALVPREEPTGAGTRSGGPTRDPDDQHILATIPHRDIDVAVEAAHPTPAARVSDQESGHLAQTSRTPSAKSFELISHLDALARDFAVVSRGELSDQRIGKAQEGPSVSLGLEKVEPSIRVSPRPSGSTNDQSASDKASIGRRTVLTFASFFMAALIGVGATIAWQSNRTTEPSGFTPALREASSDMAPQRAAATRTTTVSAASAISPELVQQLQAMAQDLTAMRNDVKPLAAEQEHLAAMQQQLEQLAAAQQQFAAKQEQMAQNLAKLQAIEQNIRNKRPPVSLPRAVPMPPRRNGPTNASPKSSAQASSAPHLRPPMPVPP